MNSYTITLYPYHAHRFARHRTTVQAIHGITARDIAIESFGYDPSGSLPFYIEIEPGGEPTEPMQLELF